MKKIVLIASIILIVSCSNNDENINSFNSLGFKTFTYDSTKSSNGTKIIEFADLNSYENMVDQLSNDVENWDDAFVSTYSNLDDDALNDKEEELKFDDEKPLSDFEKNNNFISLRNKYFEEEGIWLNNEELDDKTSPMNKDIYTFSDVEMTLMNPQGEVKIGDKIYKFLEAGTLKILDGDFDKLIRFNNGDTSVINELNVEYEDNTLKRSCDGWEKKVGSHRFGRYAVYRNVVIRTFSSFHTRVSSKIVSYKKRRRRWRKYRRNLGVAVQTYEFCGGINRPAWSGYKNKRRKRLTKRMHLWNNSSSLRAQKNNASVVGRYHYAGYTNSLELNF